MANTAYQSSYTGAEIDAAVGAVANKADKATTLSGYGITDALPLTGGTMSGNITFENAKGIIGTLSNGDTGAIMYIPDTNRLLIGYGFRTNANFVDTRIYGYTAVALVVNNTSILSANTTGATVAGTLTATSIVKSGGTSSQILMADGSTADVVKVYSGSSAPSSSTGSNGDIYIQTS